MYVYVYSSLATRVDVMFHLSRLGVHASLNVAHHLTPNLDHFEVLILYEFLIVSAVSFGHLVYGVIDEFCEILNIKCFTIPLVKKAL